MRIAAIIFGLMIIGGCDSLCDCNDETSNNPPVVENIFASPPNPRLISNGRSEPVDLTAVAIDKDGDEITYLWSTSDGKISTGLSSFSTTTNPAKWDPPGEPGIYSVTCTVSDGKETDSLTIMVEVSV